MNFFIQYSYRGLVLSVPENLQFLTTASLFKDCKWKMYIELDGDEVAVTYIKDVTFNANRQDVDILRMTKVQLEKHFWTKLERAALCFIDSVLLPHILMNMKMFQSYISDHITNDGYIFTTVALRFP